MKRFFPYAVGSAAAIFAALQFAEGASLVGQAVIAIGFGFPGSLLGGFLYESFYNVTD